MKFITSFGQINLLTTNIAEVIINDKIEVTLEIVDEYDALMAKHFAINYAILVNRINSYSFSYEALLCVASAQNLKALALINYRAENAQQTQNLKTIRHMDNLNIKEFSGLDLGRENAIKWLNEQLENANKNQTTASPSR